MARERVGECFEALLVLALSKTGLVQGADFHWGVTPKDFPIDPDITLGPPDSPTHWILATSSSSSKNSLEKFWRNLGEMVEVKRRVSSNPRIINCVLEAQQRDALQTALSSIVDGEMLVATRPYGKALIQFIESISTQMPKSRPDKLVALQEFITANKEVNEPFKKFQKELSGLVSKNINSHYASLWSASRAELRAPEVPASRYTYVRRGLAKLMLFDKAIQDSIVQSILKSTPIQAAPLFSETLGFVARKVNGLYCSDDEIKSAVLTIGQIRTKEILEKSFQDRPENWSNWRASLNASSEQAHSYLLQHFKDLCTPEGMHRHLMSHSATGYKWLFAHLMEVIKLNSGNRQGFGYSLLAKEVGYDDGISSGYLELADWVNGFMSAPKNKNMLVDVARVLARHLSSIGKVKLQGMTSSIGAESMRNLLEQKVVSYWLFEPLAHLILNALRAYGESPLYRRKHPTFIGEYLGNPTSIAAPTVITCRDTVIVWRSAYTLGVHHKTKELVGRAQALRFQFDGAKFVRRPSAKKMILVIDGTFSQVQLKQLGDAGWDHIFYPDEMDRLVKAII